MVVRSSLVITAAIAAPTLVFEPHLSSTPNPAALQEHEHRRLSQLARAGMNIYSVSCESCHGEKASGTSLGPSLWREPYVRGNRAQREFHAALTPDSKTGTGMHDTLLPEDLSFNDIEKLARFVREVRQLELGRP